MTPNDYAGGQENKGQEQDPTKYPNVRHGAPLTSESVPGPMSATDLVVGALEDFANFEPSTAIVIYRSECGCVVVRSNAPGVETIGLLEISKVSVIGAALSHGFGGSGEEEGT